MGKSAQWIFWYFGLHEYDGQIRSLNLLVLWIPWVPVLMDKSGHRIFWYFGLHEYRYWWANQVVESLECVGTDGQIRSLNLLVLWTAQISWTASLKYINKQASLLNYSFLHFSKQRQQFQWESHSASCTEIQSPAFTCCSAWEFQEEIWNYSGVN